MKKSLTTGLFVALLAALPGAGPAEALNLGPGDATYEGYTNPPSNPGMLADAQTACGNCLVTENYKSDQVGGDYTWTPDGEHGGTLAYDGSGTVFGGGWLFVKDGQANPNWYLFDVSGWDGIESVVFSGLFVADGIPVGDKNGGISHVSIWNGSEPDNPPDVPEPATFSMLAIGLVGLGVARRRSQGKVE